ncbi:MAG TPA: hypothetical protein PLD59_10765 [Tepidisphaeraceae bacterium]|nr:hypothetical protein [Tepidisphaeraceae bacterium]
MKLITAHNGQLIETAESAWTDAARPRGQQTGLPLLDALLPAGGLTQGAVHELLFKHEHPRPYAVAAIFLQLREKETKRKRDEVEDQACAHSLSLSVSRPLSLCTSPTIIWSDATHTLYPPALFAAGINPHDLWILHPRTEQEALWAAAECLRCKGVGVTVTQLPARLHRNDVRRLQLAAERGGGMGIIMRPMTRGSEIYAAATRWLVEPARGERTIHRWKLTLLHGHGGQVGESIFLERCRENNLVRATAQLARGPSFAAARWETA